MSMKTINAKVKFGIAGLVALVTVFAATVIFTQTKQIENASLVNRDLAIAETADELALEIKDVRYDIVQVQQFLTDISATRGLDGLSDGTELAAEAAKAFEENSAHALALAKELKFADVVSGVESARAAFPGYYAAGQEMARAYIAGGPASGNQFMGAFDEAAQKVGNAMDALAESIDAKMMKAREEIQQATREAEQFAGLARLIAFGLSALVGACLLGAGWIVLQTLKPLSTVTHTMESMSKGNYDVVLDGAKREDEIGQMVRAIDVFRLGLVEARGLREQQAELARKAEAERQRSLKQMADSVEVEAGSAVNHVSDETATMSGLANTMANSAENVTAQCQNAAAAAQQAMMAAQSVSAATEEFAASIGEVTSQITRAKQIAGETVRTSGRTQQAVETLTQAVDRIGAVVTMISEIAGQTNLLALNATIEAARAGEAGKGFAVVASEVKALSTQTATSTEDIRRHIEEIQRVARETFDVVGEISRQIAAVDDVSTAIAAAMEEQSATMGEISRHVSETAVSAGHVSESVGIVLGEAGRTGDSARALNKSAVEVSRSISGLRETIVRVVRSSSPDVERRAHPRHPVNAKGELAQRKSPVHVEDISRGGALLTKVTGLSGGDRDVLRWSGVEASFRVASVSNGVAHVIFEQTDASFLTALAQAARTFPELAMRQAS